MVGGGGYTWNPELGNKDFWRGRAGALAVHKSAPALAAWRLADIAAGDDC
jgi:hypothetical protein